MHTPEQDSPKETKKIDSDYNRSVAGISGRLQDRSGRDGGARGAAGAPGGGGDSERERGGRRRRVSVRRGSGGGGRGEGGRLIEWSRKPRNDDVSVKCG